jgi:hypothetical protein
MKELLALLNKKPTRVTEDEEKRLSGTEDPAEEARLREELIGLLDPILYTNPQIEAERQEARVKALLEKSSHKSANEEWRRGILPRYQKVSKIVSDTLSSDTILQRRKLRERELTEKLKHSAHMLVERHGEMVSDLQKVRELLSRAAKGEQPQGTDDPLRHLLDQPIDQATLEQKRKNGVRTLVTTLNEWAEQEQLYPQWQLNDTDGTEHFALVRWLPIRSSPRNTMMANLAACFERGELARLRLCVQCGLYSSASNRKRKTFCPGETCYRLRDNQRAPARMKSYRERKRQREEAIKAYAIAMLPKLNMRLLRDLRKKNVISDSHLEALNELYERFEKGASPDDLWKETGPRIRGLFQTLQLAWVR